MAVIKHVIGSLGDIGAEILKETAKVPGDMVGNALESGGKSKQQTKTSASGSQLGALGQMDSSKDPEVNRQQARRLLQQYIGSSESPKKESTIWEKKTTEEEQQKKYLEERRKQEEKQTIRPISTKRKQGQMYGIREKTTEASKNVKAE